MKARIVRIGNSQGVRIPKPLLEQTGLSGEVELEVQDHQIIIRSADQPRSGWAQAFERMSQAGDDMLLDDVPASASSWDDEEWEW